MQRGAESFDLGGDALTAFGDTQGVIIVTFLSWLDLALPGIELSERDGLGVTTTFIEPGSPWENGYNESFSGTLRRELLSP